MLAKLKNRKITSLLFVLAIILGLVVSISAIKQVYATGINYYVAPDGDDNNPGTFEQPFKTVTKARDVVRTVDSSMDQDINVYLRGGTYAQSSTLSFGAQDSGTNSFNIIYQSYPGEQATISGGKTITGWAQEGTIWKAQVGTTVAARQLYVNGNRAVKARSPAGLPGAVKTSTGYTTSDTTMQNWGNKSNIELVINKDWKQFRCGISTISSTSITVKQPCWGNINSQYALAGNETMYVENAYEMIDTPGEWYLNQQTGWLYYLPKPGEDMATADVTMPILDTVVSVQGTLDNPVHNIRFKGITFAYTGWTRPNDNDGFAEVQANFHLIGTGGIWGLPWTKIPANIDVQNSQDISFERDIFTHLGAGGLNFGGGSKNNSVVGSQFNDISGTGLMLGEITTAKTTDSRLVPENNQIVNNYVHNVANEYHGGVGIWAGYTKGTTIAHNEVHDVPYTAISIGWGWGKEDPSIAQNNKVLNNLIYDHVQLLNDGGGIYSLSAQPGNEYAYNVIQEQDHEFGALYLDNRSRYITLDNNVVFGNTRSALLKQGQNGADGNYHDNWWQNRYTNDVWFSYDTADGAYIPTNPGPNTVVNNSVITSLSQAPASILSGAGIEAAYQDIRNNSPKPSTNPPASPVAPPAPTGLGAFCSPAGDHVTVYWNDMNHATSYLLRIDDTSNNGTSWYKSGTTDLMNEITINAYYHQIVPGKAYSWWVHSNNRIGYSAASTGSFTCAAPPDTVAPSVPQNLVATPISASQINLTWNASMDNIAVAGYKIYRNGTQIAVATNTAYSDIGLSASTTYNYTVEAYDGAGNVSGQSSQVSATTSTSTSTIPMPTNLRYSCSGSTAVNLSWSKVSGAKSYLLRLDDTSNNSASAVDGWYVSGSTDLQRQQSGNSYKAKILPGKTYNWWVHTKTNAGTSAPAYGPSFKC